MSQDDLEGRLGALLRGHDLDLPARPDATGVVQQGVVRARRRRRAVQTAIPAVLVAGAIAVGFSVLPGPEEQSEAEPAADVLTASGIGELSLGMTIGEAQAAGLVTGSAGGADGDCRIFAGVGVILQVTVSSGVVVRIDVDAFADTPEGIHFGSTLADVERAYDEVSDPAMSSGGLAVDGSDIPAVQVELDEPEGTRYTFGLNPGDVVDGSAEQLLAAITPQSEVASISLSSTSAC